MTFRRGQVRFASFRTVIAMLAGVAVVVAGVVVPGESDSANASEPATVPVAVPWLDNATGYVTSAGWSITSDEPTRFDFANWDDDDARPDYQFEVHVEDSQQATVVDSAMLVVTRDDAPNDQLTRASWTPPDSLFDEGSNYFLSVRAVDSAGNGPWSDPYRIHIAETIDPPTHVAPANDTWFAHSPDLVVNIGTIDPTPGAQVAFRVETNWDAEAPTEVLSAWVDGSDGGTISTRTNLPDGDYRWQALILSDGKSDWSPFHEFHVAQKPYAPYSVLVTQDAHTVNVNWGPYRDPSAAPLDHITVTLNPGGITQTLDAGTEQTQFNNVAWGTYTVSVSLTNIVGESPATSKSVTIAPYLASEVKDTKAVMDDNGTEVTVTWSPPDDDGGSPIDHYRVITQSGWCGESRDRETTELTIHETGLTPGCQYQTVVYPVTSVGYGGPGADGYTAFAEPKKPTDVSGRPNPGSADLFWTAPDENGAAITEYEIIASPGGQVTTIGPGSGWGAYGTRIDDLTNGIAYTFSIRAKNRAGWGEPVTIGPLAPVAGAIDSDQDGLSDDAEDRVGTDKLLTDSDNDGLSDADEVLKLSGITDPLLTDSDANGTNDGDEDSDDDSVSNHDEVIDGTSPANPDTDEDGLGDHSEHTHGTDPLLADSDSDGLSDSYEINHDTDPTEADSDSNGTDDGDEVDSRTIESAAAAPTTDDSDAPRSTAAVTASAIDTADLILTETPTAEIPGAISVAAVVNSIPIGDDSEATTTTARTAGGSRAPPASKTTSARTTSSAAPTVNHLTVGYASDVSDKLAHLKPIRWNPETSDWEFVDNDLSVSTADQTITIHSPELGVKYAIVDMTEWRAHANQCTAAASGHPALDVQIILDQTWSVTDADPTGERFTAIDTILDSLKPGDRASVRATGFIGVGGSRGVPTTDGAADHPPWWNWLDPNYGEATLESADKAKQEVDSYRDADGMEDEYYYYGAGVENWGAERLFGYDDGQKYGDAPDTAACRIHTVVLVTDGALVAPALLSPSQLDSFPAGYVPFRQRTDPVHVLDVGAAGPENSAWLVDLATRSGGTYSYVPTATDIDTWVDAVTPFDDDTDASPTADSDNDGLSDYVETLGVVPVMKNPLPGGYTRLFSDPHVADTDGDALPDGEEIGKQGTPGELGIPTTATTVGYYAFSNPQLEDGDADGVMDIDELDNGLNAFVSDFDHDDVDDGDELLWGINPALSDSDGDGFTDNVEISEHDQGYDPARYDPHISEMQWLEDVASGLVCGEFCPGDRPGWLIGNIISGLVGIGDIRDLISFAGDGDTISAGLTLFGIIPIAGDLETMFVKIAKFMGRASGVARKAAFKLGLAVVDVSATDGVTGARLIDGLDSGLRGKFTSAGMTSAEAMSILADAMDKDHLKRLLDLRKPMTRAAGVVTDFIGGIGIYRVGLNGEKYVSDALEIPVTKKVRTKVNPAASNNYRYYDLKKEVDGVTHFYEVKVGTPGYSAIRQAERDIELQNSSSDTVTWIFLASERTGKIGPSPALLQLLIDNHIPFEIHWPRGL